MAFRVGAIIGSTRAVRVGPQVTDFVLETLRAHQAGVSPPSDASSPAMKKTNKRIEFDRIDLADQALPIFDEPVIPMTVQTPDGYHHAHTRKWSRRVGSLDAFIFVAAQRNWGIPAELKNAIDFLYNEWKGKPCMIVTYGGHGGGQCDDALRTVVAGLRMSAVERRVNMAFPDAEFRNKAFKGLDLGLDAADDQGAWSQHRVKIVEAYEEMAAKLDADQSETAV